MNQRTVTLLTFPQGFLSLLAFSYVIIHGNDFTCGKSVHIILPPPDDSLIPIHTDGMMFRFPGLPYPLKHFKKTEISDCRKHFCHFFSHHVFFFQFFNPLAPAIEIPENKIRAVFLCLIHSHTAAHAVKKLPVSGFADPQSLFHFLSLGNIFQHSNEIIRLSRILAHQRHSHISPDHCPVFADIAFVSGYSFNPASHQILHQFQSGFPFIRMDNIPEKKFIQFIVFITGNPAEFSIGNDEASVCLQMRDAHCRMFKNVSESFLAFAQRGFNAHPIRNHPVCRYSQLFKLCVMQRPRIDRAVPGGGSFKKGKENSDVFHNSV